MNERAKDFVLPKTLKSRIRVMNLDVSNVLTIMPFKITHTRDERITFNDNGAEIL